MGWSGFAYEKYNHVDADGFYPIQKCTTWTELEHMLSSGGECDIKNDRGESALFYPKIKYTMARLYSLLIENHTTDKKGNTPLFVEFDDPNILYVIANSGTPWYHMNFAGKTALHTYSKNTRHILTLLDIFEDHHIKDSAGIPASYYLARYWPIMISDDSVCIYINDNERCLYIEVTDTIALFEYIQQFPDTLTENINILSTIRTNIER